jgi:hypothetical protein
MNQLLNNMHSKTLFVIFLIDVITSLNRLEFVPLCPLSESYFAIFEIVDEANPSLWHLVWPFAIACLMLIGFSDLVSLNGTLFIRFGIFGFSLSIIIWLSLRRFTQHHFIFTSVAGLVTPIMSPISLQTRPN